MTFDVWFRYVIMPAMGAGALVALILTIREAWQDWRNGEW